MLKDIRHRGDGFFFQADILIRAVKSGYLFAEVPCRLKKRERGASKAMTFSSLRRVAGGYFRLVRDFYFKKKPHQPFRYPDDTLTKVRREDKVRSSS